jgi:hypothetical protein
MSAASGRSESTSGTLLAIVINYRTAAMTLDALRALAPELRALPGARAVVVENGSGDDSAAVLGEALRREGLREVVELRVSERNTGFAGGINFALAGEPAGRPLPDFVYLLNSDAFVAPGALRALVDFMRAHPDVGICGSYIHGTDGVPHETAFRFPSLVGEFIARVPLWPFTRLLMRHTVAIPIPTQPTRVDWLAGASMLIRREVFDAIGRFDDGFFLYYEETDFCRRAAQAGFSTWYVPASRVAHAGSKSTGFQDLARPRPAYWFESRRRYLRKHHGALYLAAANLAWVASYLLGRLRERIKGLPRRDPPQLFRDFLRHNFAPARAQRTR